MMINSLQEVTMVTLRLTDFVIFGKFLKLKTVTFQRGQCKKNDDLKGYNNPLFTK